ncbi:hypothetical protein [Paenibacillus sp. 1P07SE]|uniref:hypothetical protein n=1 Tax=Paenibacillus sp. 1P07SE TaxID=3132209 RepID=UPI0039A44C0E
MGGNRMLKLAMLVLGVAAACVVVLSPGLLGLDLVAGGTMERAAGITVLVMSGLVLLYGTYQLLLRPEPPAVTVKVGELRSHEDYAAALDAYGAVDGLQKEMEHGRDQLRRMSVRRRSLNALLAERFEPGELSYTKFMRVIQEVEQLFYRNIRGMLNKLDVFDAADFRNFAKRHQTSSFSSRLVQEKTGLYREYMAAMSGYLEANEEILLKLDKLLLEISRLSSSDYRNVEEMPCMREIDALIKHTKLYRQ